MNIKALWGIVAVLAATCVAEGVYISTQTKSRGSSAEDPWAERDRWVREARKKLFEGSAIPFRRFDDLFNDEFFAHRFDPFAEIESFNKKLIPLLDEDQRSLFGRSWDEWFKDRMDASVLRHETRITDKEVIVSLKIPGLEGSSLDIDVNKDRIRVTYDAKKLLEGKGVKSESTRHYEKIIPVPSGADPDRSRIVRDGGVVNIIFEKRRDRERTSF